MPRNSQTILPTITHRGDSAVQSEVSEKFAGDGFFSRADGFHTVQYNLNGFVGTIFMQATLAVDPKEEDWFSLLETQCISTNADDEKSTGGFYYNFTGNYVWVRAIVSNWTNGTIRSILFNH